MIIKVDRTATLVEDYFHVFRDDPALDKSSDGWEESYARYLETGLRNELPLKEGQSPAFWKMQHLRGTQKAMIQDSWNVARDSNKWARCVYTAAALALVSVDGLFNETGDPIELERVMDPDDGVMRLSESTIKMLSDVSGLMEDLGSVAIKKIGVAGK